MKKLLFGLTLFISFQSYSQNTKPVIPKLIYGVGGFSAGYSVTKQVPIIYPSIGVRIKDCYLSFNEILPLTSDHITVPNIFIGTLGYNVKGFQPFISYGYQGIGSEAAQRFKDDNNTFISGWKWGYGISYYLKNMPLSITVQRSGKQTMLSTGIYQSF